MKRPQNRKLLIRDLPVSVAYLLHPQLRGILLNHQKRWKNKNPPHRIAVNIVRKYKRRPKPRVLPFFCNKCRLATRSFSLVKDHTCQKDEVRKARRHEATRKLAAYDYKSDNKLTENLGKQWRFSAMAVMEKSLNPEKIEWERPKTVEEVTDLQKIHKRLDEKSVEVQQQESAIECYNYPLNAVLVPSEQIRPETTLPAINCFGHDEAGVFCFTCKVSFETFNQYQLHLRADFNNGACNKTLPNYCKTQKSDKTGVFNMKHKHSLMHHVAAKRDVTHVKCTMCNKTNFENTDALYSHMLDCANRETM